MLVSKYGPLVAPRAAVVGGCATSSLESSVAVKVIFEHNAPELHSFVHLIVVRAFFKDTLKLVILLGNCLTLSRLVIKGTQIVVELKTTCLFPRVKEVVVLVLISRQ